MLPDEADKRGVLPETAVSPSPVSPTPTDEQAEVVMNDIPSHDAPFRVLAYATTAIVPQVIPYEQLTHLNYAFLIPNADGSFLPLVNGWKLKTIVQEAHAHGVQVLISVGGWGWEKEFEVMAADPQARAAFVSNLRLLVDEYDLDGVDMDWEYPLPGPGADNFLTLSQELRAAFPDKLLTTAVVAYGATGEGMLAETFALYDFINVMTYDGPDHGTMAQFEAGLAYWLSRGVPPEKLVMGVPFYSRPSEALYRKIVEADPQAAQMDTVEWNGTVNHYNGIPTIQAKTRMALAQAGGIMFWSLEHDALDELSLVKAIDDVMRQP
ncbi:MAG: glycosyl hydrolase family 18 protein [Chloroflexota bacterium]